MATHEPNKWRTILECISAPYGAMQNVLIFQNHTDGVTVFDAAAIRQWNEQKTGGENA